MSAARLASILFGSSLLLVACGPSNRNGDDTTDGTDANDSTDGSMGDGGLLTDGTNVDECSDDAKLVYVVSEDNTFSKFDPATKTFMDIGTLSCPAGGATPFSMGVDRDANAWILFSNSHVYKVSTETPGTGCVDTGYTVSNNLQQFGMGFSTAGTGSDIDTLFVAGGPNSSDPDTHAKLATFDTNTKQTTIVGTVDGSPELTGTGSGELWGFFPGVTTTPKVEKINKASGAALKTYPLSSLSGQPMAWAFAFWGGDFWVFLAKDTDAATKVYHINGMTGAIVGPPISAGNRMIVGAGVSTCAPVIIGKQQH